MPSLREFFVTEATDILARLTGLVQRLDDGSGEPAELQRDVRALRGSAQMAREDRAYRAALALEDAARSLVAGALKWNDQVSTRIRRSLEDLHALVHRNESDAEADARVQRSLEEWGELGVGSAGDPPSASNAQTSAGSRQFLQFAAHEVAGIISEMDVSLEMLAADPRSHDPLKSILRRERALLGATRLDEIGVVAEALRATDDVTRLLAKLNVPVKQEWLAVFRSAREVLKSSLDALQQGEYPAASPSLSQLRVLRQELLERHGEADASATGAQRAVSSAAPPLTYSDDVVPIEQLCYSGERALQRALELKPEIDALAANDSAAREAIEEVFDLMRLGIA